MGGGAPGDDWRVGVNKDDIGDLWLSGYSKGGAMTYDMACLGEEVYAGFLPMSGAFQDWVPELCEHDARLIRHLQGAEDDKWPLNTADDPTSSHEGIIDSLRGLQSAGDGCMESAPVEEESCLSWPSCGVDVRLCFFEGGHTKPDGWILDHRAWIDGL